MQTRKFGSLGYDVSALGLGCMRLPRLETTDSSGEVDKEKAIELIQYAVDNGVNYFDSSFTYHNGQSEAVIGEAFDGGRRQKAIIATKQRYPSMQNSKEVMRANLETTLKRLRTDYLDLYLIHNVNINEWEGVKELEVFEEYEKFKAEGMIKAIGFSYHGNLELFKEVINFYDFDMCQFQYNLLMSDRELPNEGLELAYSKGCAVVVMEPLRGGGLASAPKEVLDIYSRCNLERTPAEWGLRYVMDRPEVSVVLSGMSTLEQLKENIATFTAPDAIPYCLTENEKQILANARLTYLNRTSIPCTGCEYCLPCPQGVNIPDIFSKYNEGYRFDKFDNARRTYMFSKTAGTDGSHCVGCGECLAKCPQSIDIIEQVAKAHKVLDGWQES
ncbi:MAG: aldo/keto reductase [Oscillospiraceae bacterium]|nr:aldo/keto reductase [Oscillospiraceae bacterium]